MPTIHRGYPDLPTNAAPDVPHWVGVSLRAVDQDVEDVEAAARAAAEALAGRLDQAEDTLVRTVKDGDPRLMESVPAEELSVAVLDSADRRTWIEAGLDGRPTAEAAAAIASALGIEDVALDSPETFVVVDDQDRILYSLTAAVQEETPGIPGDDWVHLGDSMTDDAVTGTGAWVAKLAALTGRKHHNGGWYGQTAAQIAARHGALPPLVTLAGNVTAATGPSPVTVIRNTPVLRHATRAVRGSLAGIPGSLARRTEDLTTFTPDTPGVYSVPPASRFTPQDAALLPGRIATIWAGRNDVWTTEPAVVVAHVQAMVDALGPGVRRVLVFDLPPSTADGGGLARREAIDAALAAAFPAFWFPVCRWLRTDEAAAAAAVEFTTEDRADIAKGNTPAVFRLDNLHINATGCTAVARRTYDEAIKRGWI